jgi:hypothetical protein
VTVNPTCEHFRVARERAGHVGQVRRVDRSVEGDEDSARGAEGILAGAQERERLGDEVDVAGVREEIEPEVLTRIAQLFAGERRIEERGPRAERELRLGAGKRFEIAGSEGSRDYTCGD